MNYVGALIENMSTKTKPLRDPVEDDVQFTWVEPQREVFEELKASLGKAPVLRYFNPDELVVLSVDASEFAVGAVLLQAGRPVAYSSKALTAAQQKRPQIEKEIITDREGNEKYLRTTSPYRAFS